MEIAILGLGCFWGPERKFGEIDGVTILKSDTALEKIKIQIIKKFALVPLDMLK